MSVQKGAVAFGLLLVSAFACFGCAGQPTASPLHGVRFEPPKLAPDFTLTDQNGNPFTLGSTRGQVVMLYFGYTSCPDVCPLTLVDMATARKELGKDAELVRVVFVTVDPERDAQAVLSRYVPAFDESFIGVRGTPEEIKTVADAYGVQYKKTPLPNSALGYAVDHTAFIYVIDRSGRLRQVLPFGTKRQDITSDLRILVVEGAES
ncbi:MAG: SCO family protein [Chloroflexi bacterium]|nr:SCO family protein [Chloroflexota bacterium]